MSEHHKKYLYSDQDILEDARVIHSKHPHYYALVESQKLNDGGNPTFHSAIIHLDGRITWNYIVRGVLVKHYYDEMGPEFINTFEDSDPEFFHLFNEQYIAFVVKEDEAPAIDIQHLFRGMHYRELMEFFLRDRYYEVVHDYDESILEYLSRMEFEEDRDVLVNASSYLEHEKYEVLQRLFYEELRDLNPRHHETAYVVVSAFLVALRENADTETIDLINFIESAESAPLFFKRLCLHLRHLQG